MKKDNYGFEIMRCLDTRGFIPPGQSASLRWVFQPLEAKEYMAEVGIQVMEGEMSTVRFCGKGFIPETKESGDGEKALEADFIKVPAVETLFTEEQLACTSVEVVNMGKIPSFSTQRSLIILRNLTKQNELDFEVVVPEARGGEGALTALLSSPSYILHIDGLFWVEHRSASVSVAWTAQAVRDDTVSSGC